MHLNHTGGSSPPHQPCMVIPLPPHSYQQRRLSALSTFATLKWLCYVSVCKYFHIFLGYWSVLFSYEFHAPFLLIFWKSFALEILTLCSLIANICFTSIIYWLFYSIFCNDTYYVPDIIICTKDSLVIKIDKNLFLLDFIFQGSNTVNQSIIIIYSALIWFLKLLCCQVGLTFLTVFLGFQS